MNLISICNDAADIIHVKANSDGGSVTETIAILKKMTEDQTNFNLISICDDVSNDDSNTRSEMNHRSESTVVKTVHQTSDLSAL